MIGRVKYRPDKNLAVSKNRVGFQGAIFYGQKDWEGYVIRGVGAFSLA